MSYSFKIAGSSKSEAKNLVSAELEKVVQLQPIHAADAPKAQAAADAYIDLLLDDPARNIEVAIHGSVGSNPDGLTHAGVGITAQLVLR